MLDIVQNILLLSILFMKWHVVSCQGFENIPDINLRTAGDTKMNMCELHVDKCFQYVQGLFSWRRVPGKIWAFIKGIYNEIQCPLARKSEHTLQAPLKCIYAGLLRAVTMGRIDRGEKFRECLGPMTELYENRRE